MVDLANAGLSVALGLAARRAQQPPPEVTAQITGLMQAYALFTDLGKAAEIAELFTPDATWNGEEIGYGEASGPQAIAETVVSHYHADEPMVHLPGPPLAVLVSPTEVEAYSWCLATRQRDGVTTPVIYFCYEDRLRCVDNFWLFSHRHLRLRFRGTSS